MAANVLTARDHDPFRISPRLRPPRRDQDDRRLRITRCAATIFVNRGFDAANMEDVALAAGVGKLSIYQLFANKSELFASVILQAVQEMSAPLSQTLHLDEPVETVLIRFAELYLDRMIRPVGGGPPFHAFAHSLVATARTHPELAHSSMAILQRHIGEPLTRYIAAKIETGEIRQEDPEFLSTHLTQMLFFTNRVAIAPDTCPNSRDIAALGRRVIKLFLYGSHR